MTFFSLTRQRIRSNCLCRSFFSPQFDQWWTIEVTLINDRSFPSQSVCRRFICPQMLFLLSDELNSSATDIAINYDLSKAKVRSFIFYNQVTNWILLFFDLAFLHVLLSVWLTYVVQLRFSSTNWDFRLKLCSLTQWKKNANDSPFSRWNCFVHLTYSFTENRNNENKFKKNIVENKNFLFFSFDDVLEVTIFSIMKKKNPRLIRSKLMPMMEEQIRSKLFVVFLLKVSHLSPM